MSNSTVFIVDDDSAVRRSLKMLMKSVGLVAETFASADEFLDQFDHRRAGCLVLDVRMPGMSGLELQEKLDEMHAGIPIVFITAHGDIPMAVETMKAGAVDFVQKPFRDQALVDCVRKALERDGVLRNSLQDHELLRTRHATLTPREQEVLDKVVDGLPNKAIAIDLGVSERTIEIHRSRAMAKMKAESLPHLVKMVIRLRDVASS